MLSPLFTQGSPSWGWPRVVSAARAALLALATAIIAGCAQPRVPEDHFYRLVTPTSEEGFSAPLLRGTLVVKRFRAHGLIGQRALVYSHGGGQPELMQYHYHYWTEPPTRMLQEVTVAYLRRVNLATHVTTPELGIEPDYTLFGKIRRLEQLRGDPARVVVQLEFGLTRRRDGQLIWLNDYVAEINTTDESITSAISAFNEGLRQIYAEILVDIAASGDAAMVERIPSFACLNEAA